MHPDSAPAASPSERDETPPPHGGSPRTVFVLAVLVTLVAVVMITLGAVVTSRDAGLSIPDGVSNHGAVVPSAQLESGWSDPATGRAYSAADVRSEFVHRAVGWTLGLLTLTLAFALHRSEPRRGVRRLGLLAVALVAVQGALGAAGVHWRQPLWLVVPHALLAQAFLATLVTIAASQTRESRSPLPAEESSVLRSIRRIAPIALAAIVLQLLLGALHRHDGSPVAFGAHVVLAFVILALVGAMATLLAGSAAPTGSRWHGRLERHARLLGMLAVVQVFLGFASWLFRVPKQAGGDRSLASLLFPTLHVVVGAAILGVAWLLVLGAWRATAGAGARAAMRDDRATLAGASA